MAIGLVTSLGVTSRTGQSINGPPLTDRKVRILVTQPTKTIGDKVTGTVTEITDLQVTFDVEKTLGKGPNSASVVITNMSATSRGSFQEKGGLLVVQAGYPANVTTVFRGDIRTIEHLHTNGVEWQTKIKAGDGDRGFLFGRVSENFPAGTKLPDVLETIARPMGYELPDFNKVTGLAALQFTNGYVAVGRASNEMDRVLQAAGYEWSVQDGRLQILKKGETPKQQVVVLSSATGLIGSPEYCAPEKKGKPPILKFKALLSPQIFPGGLLSFESLNHKGMHLVKKCKHTGDTDGGNWFTEGECEATETPTTDGPSSPVTGRPATAVTEAFKAKLKAFTVPLLQEFAKTGKKQPLSLSGFSKSLGRTPSDSEIKFIKLSVGPGGVVP